MAISCSCPQCAAKFRLDDRYAGKNIRCPKCAASMTVPAAGETASTTTSTVAPRSPTATPTPPKAPQARPTPPAGTAPSVAPSRPVVPRAPVARPTPAAPIPTAEIEEPAPGPMVVVNAPSVAPRKPAEANAPAAKKSNQTLLLAGGGAIAAAALIAAVFIFANPFGGGSPKKTPLAKKSAAEKATSGKDGTLVLDWSESDRTNAKLTIDGRTQSINSTGPIELTLKPGSHRVAIMRRSFEPINVEINVPAGGRAEFTPGWKAVETPSIAANTTPGTNTTVKPIEGSSFRPGSAVVPQGFDGWEQSLMLARTRAAQDKKDILILFGSSDGSPPTVQLAEGLKAAGLPNGELGKQYVPVIVDFPTTADGYNRVNDRRQNIELARDFRIQSLDDGPTVVLADGQGRPYAIERDLEDPQAAEVLQNLAAQKTERDKLLTAATTGSAAEKLAGAAAIAEWIEERDFASFYKDDLQTWLAAAKQLDPENAQGRLEALAECDLVSRLHRVDLRNRVEIVRQLADTDVWLKRQFVNPDRGARIHLLVGSLLSEYGSEKQGRAHFQRAVTYTPKNSVLAERISGLKLALEHEDVLSTGTGFVIASGGYLLTNKHVIEGPGKLVVRIPGIKEPVAATVVAQHDKRDIALVKASFPATFNPEPIAIAPGDLSRGLEVGAFGYPQGDVLGESLKFTKGAVSATRSRENMILLDVLVNPGNSGGPLCDNQGNAVGMVTAKTNADSDNYGFAIPAAELDEFLTQALPPGAKRSAPATVAKTWDKVDQQISEAVLMLIKTR